MAEGPLTSSPAQGTQLTRFLPHPRHSLQGSGPDPEMVPALHGAPGDAAAVHLEHLPVRGVRRATGPGQGAVGLGRGGPPALPSDPGAAGPGAQSCSRSGPLLGPFPLTSTAKSSWVLPQLHDFFSYLVDHFTPSSHSERECEPPGPPVWGPQVWG